MNYGAPLKTWDAYRNAGWSSMMLPVVSNPNAKRDPSSKLKALGKTPSVLTPSGTVVGLRGWTTLKVGTRQLDMWSSKDYGICLRCGEIAAFDCDIDDAELSAKLLGLFNIFFGDVPLRRRLGSNRWLAVVRIDIPLSKTIVKFEGNDALELLCSGQQFVAEGTHPSGARYTWSPAAPVLDELPTVRSEDIEHFLKQVADELKGSIKAGRKQAVREKNAEGLLPDPLADWLRASGLVLNEDNGVLDIICPWHDAHTTESNDTATRYYSRGSRGDKQPGFKCLHAHCIDKNYEDLLAWAHEQGYEDPAVSEGLPALDPVPQDEKEEARLFRILRKATNEKTAEIEANLSTVIAALQLKNYCRVQLAYDTFTGAAVYKDIASNGRPLRGDRGAFKDWAPFGDAEMILMRERLQREFNFKPVSGDLMRDAVTAVAQGGITVVDTMLEFLNKNLPVWDGTPRVNQFFAKYCGCVDDSYSAALGRYVFAALAGRALSPNGIKADIVPILIGKQGTYKSTLIAALAFKPGTNRELSFNKRDDDIRRAMRGASVVEIPELSGLARREAADVKFFLSLSEDSWIPKYQESLHTVKRRCVFFASTNEHQILNDPTGSRRFAPIETGAIDIESIRPLIPQLWAEGREIFMSEGIDHRKVEVLAAARAANFELRDPWAEELIAWMQDEEAKPESERVLPTTRALLTYALGVPASRSKMADSRRVGNLMRSLGYLVRFAKGDGGKTVRVWVK